MYGGGQLLGANAGGSGSKDKRVADIAARDTYIGKASDGQKFFVLDATDDPEVHAINGETWGRYQYEKATQTFILIGKVNEDHYVPNVGDDAKLAAPFLNYQAGDPASTIKANPPTFTQMEDDEKFPTVPHVYDPPAADLTNITGIVEVGEVFNIDIDASFDQDDAGNATEVRIEKNGVVVKTSNVLPLDYSYAENNLVLNDGGQLQYQARIDYAEGPVINDTSGKGIPTPGNIQAGTVSSAVRTKTPLRKIFHGKSVAKPTDTASVRALPNSQFANDLTFTVQLQAGDTSIPIWVPSHLTLQSAVFVGAFTSDLVADFLSTLEVVDVDGPEGGYTNSGRLFYYVFPVAVVGNPIINITLKAV